jgi:hypothetical protein
MSLEKRKDTKEKEEEERLEDSSFRVDDFTPLELKKEREKVEAPVEKLSEIERDVLEIAKDILKLKRFDTEFEIKSQTQIQKYPIIEKLYATCISKLAYNKWYSK